MFTCVDNDALQVFNQTLFSDPDEYMRLKYLLSLQDRFAKKCVISFIASDDAKNLNTMYSSTATQG